MQSTRSWRAVYLLLCLLILSAASVGTRASAQDAPKKAPKGALDGMSFVGEISEKGKKAEPDTLVFKKGKFHSKGCDEYGFEKVKYTAQKEGNAISWEAEAVSAKEGKMKWKGTVQEKMIEASAVWTRAGQAPIEYAFKGALKKKRV